MELRTLESFRLGTPGGDLRISNNNIRSSPGYGFYFRDIMGINISIFAIPKPTLLIYNSLWSTEGQWGSVFFYFLICNHLNTDYTLFWDTLYVGNKVTGLTNRLLSLGH